MVTGSSGFIGSNFIKKSPEYSIMEADLLANKVDDFNFSDCDCVIHLAALVHQMNSASEDKYFAINRDLAYAVAKRAKAQGVKQFVLMSTVKVFGESTTGKKPWDENSPCNPVDQYGESKLQAEKLLQSLEDKNFRVAIIRCPLVYGSGVKANMLNLIKLIDRFPILPLDGILNKRSMVFTGNLVALIKQVINKMESGIFIASDEISISTSALVKEISKCLNKRTLLFKIPDFLIYLTKYLKPSIINRLWDSLELDNKISNQKLGFSPPYSTNTGIKEMVDWYLENKHNKLE
jgi:UDP-glucose 4-epimerase